MGGLIVYANYFHAIKIVDPDLTRTTASLFATYASDYLPGGTYVPCSSYHKTFSKAHITLFSIRPHFTAAACFFSEFLGTAILLIGLLAATDKANGPPPAGLVPLVLLIIFLGEGTALGMQTAFALNPVRHVQMVPLTTEHNSFYC